MQCVRYVNQDKPTELLKPVYAKRELLKGYRNEVETHSARGEQVRMPFKDSYCEFACTRPLTLMERNLSHNSKGNPDKPPEKYHRLIKAQKGVMAHVKQCYKIRSEEAKKQREKQENYKYLLEKSVDCDFP